MGLVAFALVACSSSEEPALLFEPANDDPGTPVVTDPPVAVDIERELAATRDLTFAEFSQRYAMSLMADPAYDATNATNLDLIQASAIGLNDAELSKLSDNGFVISSRQQFPSFMYGYDTLYALDLPLYVSADSILHAVHRSYGDILKAVERASLIAELDQFLRALRDSLAQGAAEGVAAEVQADVDLFVTVALSALSGQVEPPVRGADPRAVATLFNKIQAAEGAETIELFGARRRLDFSQFKPRGHYTDFPELELYFRAMMWLGRIDFRIIETQEDLTQVFHRHQFEGAAAIHAITDASAEARWVRIDNTIGAFVGEHDSMTLPEVGDLMTDLGVTELSELSELSDETIAKAVIDGGYGAQRISSHYMVNGLGAGTMPLNQSFLLMGQRYVLDSHVFSNVVYDRVQGGSVRRMMPNSLDVAFAALGNNQAAQLLADELQEFNYAPDLHAMRYLADAHGPEYWSANLYNLWLSALRALSPNSVEIADPAAHGLPTVAATEAFGRRILNTQLASWAELRHDTILYAKQSYTGGAACEFPDAYVEPYPEFYAALEAFAEAGQAMIADLDFGAAQPWLQTRTQDFFTNLYQVASMLHEMAKFQREGRPFTDTHMAFINETVRIQWGCGTPAGAEGWYARLYFDPAGGSEEDPTIADVHTQPTDAGGNPVGRVLHVATGLPRLMVVSVETCQGVRSYAGLASAYHERVTENFQRLNDDEWSQELFNSAPAEVPWMLDLIAQ